MTAQSSSSSYGSGSIEDIKGKAKQSFDAAADRVQEAASEARDQVEDFAGNIKGQIDRSVRDQPLTTLLTAAAIGFVVGAIWKS
ncbi:hypothetical protein DLM45_16415 [Hyphomicrobium methylovorum]|uniref:hypothetical protein n=1 Tax=Hyphomicrobium methylovorum TaxID=84 RepID=UPI0015E713BA|nr:hypothetical protein [Hyphomicrobium methylovorum]MBA2127796.1 hypothetical protein [Hyphomicrobium methylovorum]